MKKKRPAKTKKQSKKAQPASEKKQREVVKKPPSHELACSSIDRFIHLAQGKYAKDIAARSMVLQSVWTLMEHLAGMHVPEKARAQVARKVRNTAAIIAQNGWQSTAMIDGFIQLPILAEAIEENRPFDAFDAAA